MLRVAVVGSGPSGVYTAQSLVEQTAVPDVRVHVLDRLPCPYGLVRYGVAPDHPKIKSLQNTLRAVLEHERVTFVGNVPVGDGALTPARLLELYHAVVYCVGAARDRRLGIPGEDLAGSCSATDFVAWYSAHPDAWARRFALDTVRSAVVVGAGNVAVDVTRILARSPEELRPTDVPSAALGAFTASTVREVHMVARRGPSQGRFTTKELRELGTLPYARVTVTESDLSLDPAYEDPTGLPAVNRRNVEVIRGWAAASGAAAEVPGGKRLSGPAPAPDPSRTSDDRRALGPEPGPDAGRAPGTGRTLGTEAEPDAGRAPGTGRTLGTEAEPNAGQASGAGRALGQEPEPDAGQAPGTGRTLGTEAEPNAGQASGAGRALGQEPEPETGLAPGTGQTLAAEPEPGAGQASGRGSVLGVGAGSGVARGSSGRVVRLRFFLRPVEILGAGGRVAGVRFERTVPDGAGGVRGTGRYEEIAAELVLRAVGYRGAPPEGLPIDAARGTVPHAAGRVLRDGAPSPGEYVAGWIKRGPSGVIGTNRPCAKETAASVLADAHLLARRAVAPDPLDAMRAWGLRPVEWHGWLAIERAETALGRALGRDRVKIPDWEGLLRAAEGTDAGTSGA